MKDIFSLWLCQTLLILVLEHISICHAYDAKDLYELVGKNHELLSSNRFGEPYNLKVANQIYEAVHAGRAVRPKYQNHISGVADDTEFIRPRNQRKPFQPRYGDGSNTDVNDNIIEEDAFTGSDINEDSNTQVISSKLLSGSYFAKPSAAGCTCEAPEPADQVSFLCFSTAGGDHFSMKYKGTVKFSLEDILKAYKVYFDNVQFDKFYFENVLNAKDILNHQFNGDKKFNVDSSQTHVIHKYISNNDVSNLFKNKKFHINTDVQAHGQSDIAAYIKALSKAKALAKVKALIQAQSQYGSKGQQDANFQAMTQNQIFSQVLAEAQAQAQDEAQVQVEAQEQAQAEAMAEALAQADAQIKFQNQAQTYAQFLAHKKAHAHAKGQINTQAQTFSFSKTKNNAFNFGGGGIKGNGGFVVTGATGGGFSIGGGASGYMGGGAGGSIAGGAGGNTGGGADGSIAGGAGGNIGGDASGSIADGAGGNIGGDASGSIAEGAGGNIGDAASGSMGGGAGGNIGGGASGSIGGGAGGSIAGGTGGSMGGGAGGRFTIGGGAGGSIGGGGGDGFGLGGGFGFSGGIGGIKERYAGARDKLNFEDRYDDENSDGANPYGSHTAVLATPGSHRNANDSPKDNDYRFSAYGSHHRKPYKL